MAEVHAHRTVLLGEAVAALNIRGDGIYLDGTFGRGGHARAILERLGPKGRLLAFDKDPQAVKSAQELMAQDDRLEIERGSFAMVREAVKRRDWVGQVDGVLLDLGVSSPQLDDAERGFSFRHDGPLDMRMDPHVGMSAAEWLAEAAERDIAQVLKEYGEERFAKRIARAVVKARAETPLSTTGQLAALIAAAVPTREPGKDPATRSFQAIRIFINRELDDLAACLEQMPEVLAPGGRLVVISFHSLEDRMVKRFMRDQARGDEFPPDLPVTVAQLKPRFKVVGRAVSPGPDEVAANPRARSAVMRVAERLA